MGGDSKRTLALEQEFPQHTLTYGIEAHNDIVASHIDFTRDENEHVTGMQFRVDEKGSSIPVVIKGRVGTQQIHPVLAAFAVAQALGIGPLKVAKALETEEGPRGRMRVLKGITIQQLLMTRIILRQLHYAQH